MRLKFYIIYSMRLTTPILLLVLSGCSGARSFICAWGEADQLVPNRLTGGYALVKGSSYESCMTPIKEVK